MSFADLSGVLVHRLMLTIPWSGRWHADMSLVDATDISGPQTLNLVGVPWACAYVRAIDYAGDRGVRVVAGAGGWSTTIRDKQYGDGVIATSTVCNDAALACGEVSPVIDASLPPTVGAAFLRQRGPAVTVLQEVLGDGWWTDTTGRVQTKARNGTISSAFTVTKVDGASGIFEIGTSSPNDWMPGVTFTAPTVSGTVSRVTHIIDRNRVKTEVVVV